VSGIRPEEGNPLTTPKWLRHNTPDSSEAALAADTERILQALEQGKRATMRPMPAPPRTSPPDRDSARPR
jgi:hypothetical protein